MEQAKGLGHLTRSLFYVNIKAQKLPIGWLNQYTAAVNEYHEDIIRLLFKHRSLLCLAKEIVLSGLEKLKVLIFTYFCGKPKKLENLLLVLKVSFVTCTTKNKPEKSNNFTFDAIFQTHMEVHSEIVVVWCSYHKFYIEKGSEKIVKLSFM